MSPTLSMAGCRRAQPGAVLCRERSSALLEAVTVVSCMEGRIPQHPTPSALPVCLHLPPRDFLSLGGSEIDAALMVGHSKVALWFGPIMTIFSYLCSLKEEASLFKIDSSTNK